MVTAKSTVLPSTEELVIATSDPTLATAAWVVSIQTGDPDLKSMSSGLFNTVSELRSAAAELAR